MSAVRPPVPRTVIETPQKVFIAREAIQLIHIT